MLRISFAFSFCLFWFCFEGVREREKKNLQRKIKTVKKIANFFHVDFEIRYRHSKFSGGRGIHDGSENVIDNAGNNSAKFRIINIRTLY